MKNIAPILFLIPLILFCVCQAENNLFVEKWIELPVDHFNYANNKTFKLRYLINDSYIGNGHQSPILFYTGGEGDIELFAKITGFMWENAHELNALIVFAEHRYYGKSLPFGEKTNTSNLGFLTVEQALADYAEILNDVLNGTNDRPIIAIGGSYSGMLAAWFRNKYPHFILGALASSAPIFQLSDLTDCNVMSRIITSIYKTAYNRNCVPNIKNSWNTLKNYSSTENGRTFLNKEFKFCKNLTKPEEIEVFFDYLEDVYGNLAMINYPYDNDFLAKVPAYPVRQFCGQLGKEYQGDNLMIALKNALSIYTNYSGNLKCLDYSTSYEPSISASTFEFQTCTEMVMPMCSDKISMFRPKEWNYENFSKECFKKFNVKPRKSELITRFGGKNLESASNIIFSNGLLDPWSGGGVLISSNNKLSIIIIPEGAHHIDLRFSNSNDPTSVRSARKIELDIIKKWIEDYYWNYYNDFNLMIPPRKHESFHQF